MATAFIERVRSDETKERLRPSSKSGRPVSRKQRDLVVDNRSTAVAEFKRIMKWIAAIAAFMVVAALTYLQLFSTLDGATVIATTTGVFFSVLLGCGLFAAAFFSDKSGFDQEVADATRSELKHAKRIQSLTVIRERNRP